MAFNPDKWEVIIRKSTHCLNTLFMGFVSKKQTQLNILRVSITKGLVRSKHINHTGIFLPFQNRDPGPMILGKIIRISVKLGKWIQNRTGDIMHIWC